MCIEVEIIFFFVEFLSRASLAGMVAPRKLCGEKGKKRERVPARSVMSEIFVGG